MKWWHWNNLVATKKMLICVGLIYVIICLNLCCNSYTSFWKHFSSTKSSKNSYTYIHHPDSHNVNTWYIIIISLYNCTVNTETTVLIYLKFLLEFHQFFPWCPPSIPGSSLGSHIAFNCCVSLASSTLWQFLSFMSLILLMSSLLENVSHLCLSDIFYS